MIVVSLLSCRLGPGLSIRVICAEEPYICKDFAETNNILKIVADFSASVKKVSEVGRGGCTWIDYQINGDVTLFLLGEKSTNVAL